MENYTAYCVDESGFTEEIDFQAANIIEARQKIKEIIKDEYCNSLNLKKLVKQSGAWV